MRRPLRWVLCVALATGGCLPHRRAAAPEPAVALPDRFTPPAEEAPALADGADDRWWLRYDDPVLHRLVERALASNLSLRSGFAAIEQARALHDQARAAQLPRVAAQASGGYTRTITAFGSGNSWRVDASLPVSYEVDLFARHRGNRRAASEDVAASELDAAALAISTSAQVAEAWYSVVEARRRKRVLTEQRRIDETYLELVQLRFARGLASAVDVHQQRQKVAASAARLALVDAEIDVLRQQLAVLLGTPATELGPLPEVVDFPPLGPSPAPGIPASAVWARPDVRAAQRRVQASDWRVGSAIASRLPSVTLSVTPGYTWSRNEFGFAGMPARPTTAHGWTLNAGASLSVPLFDGFAGRGRVEQQRATLQRQIEALAQTILTALLEVESAIVQERQQAQSVALIEEQLELAEQTLQSARDRYRAGLSDFLPVLTALQAQQGLQLQLLAARRQLISRRIQLHRALGGAWADDLDRPTPTPLREGDRG